MAKHNIKHLSIENLNGICMMIILMDKDTGII